MTLARLLMMKSAGGATITPAYNAAVDGDGYMNSTAAVIYGTSAFGAITGAVTPFGTVAIMVANDGNVLGLSSPVGTPSTLTINGVTVGLEYGATISGIDIYNFDAAIGDLTPGVTYPWSIA